LSPIEKQEISVNNLLHKRKLCRVTKKGKVRDVENMA
jgi:hypothetical protein